MENVSSSNGLEKHPKFRFPGFDEPWCEVKIKDIFRVTRGSVLAADKVLLSKIDGYEYPVYSSQTKADGLLGYYNTYLYENAITWTTDGANAGTVHYRAGKFYCTNVCGVLLNKDGYANRCTAAILGSISKKYVSYVGNPKLMNNIMSEIPIIIPALEEQHKIDSFIAVLDKRIKAQQMMITSLKKYKRGLNRRLLSQIEESYNCKLGSVCTIMGGGTPDTLHDEYWGNSVEWFTPSEIGKTKYVNSSVRKLSNEGLSNSSAKLLPAGTVLLTTRATLGEMSIAEKECSTNQGFQSLIPLMSRVSSEYLYYMQIIIKPWCEKYASGNTFREISKSALSECIIPVPEKTQQDKIVKLLSAVDTLIAFEEKETSLLVQMKNSLLQQLFI